MNPNEHSLGPDFMRRIAGGGLATADVDNDGDIAINNRGDYPELLRNDRGNTNHWLEVLLIGTRSNRDGIGSSLKLTSEGVAHVEQSKGGKRNRGVRLASRLVRFRISTQASFSLVDRRL